MKTENPFVLSKETLIHFMSLLGSKTKLNNLRGERFGKSDVEPGLMLELLALTQLKVVHSVEISEKAKNNSSCSSLEIIIPLLFLCMSVLRP